MNLDRPVLDRSMLERYEIAVHRPSELRAVIFGMDEMMLGGIARALDRYDIGVLVVTGKANVLAGQDCMFTILERGGQATKEKECVVQSVLSVVDPDKDFEELMEYAERDDIAALFCRAEADVVELALAARFICQLQLNGKNTPIVYLVSDLPERNCEVHARNAFKTVATRWGDPLNWEEIRIYPLICETLCGWLAPAEAQRRQEMMNYSDKLIMWGQPELRLLSHESALSAITETDDYSAEFKIVAETDRALEFMCATGGYLDGKDTYSDVLRDDDLRKWIAHAWFDEIMTGREEDVLFRERTIKAFEKFEDTYNAIPLLSAQRLLKRFRYTLLPRIREYAFENFDVPRLTVLAFSSAILLYAGVIRSEQGYVIKRGGVSELINDDPDILSSFETFSVDMPAETIAYAVLADRDLWNEDLREIDGLEMAIVSDISSIQRIGFKETLKNKIAQL